MKFEVNDYSKDILLYYLKLILSLKQYKCIKYKAQQKANKVVWCSFQYVITNLLLQTPLMLNVTIQQNHLSLQESKQFYSLLQVRMCKRKMLIGL